MQGVREVVVVKENISLKIKHISLLNDDFGTTAIRTWLGILHINEVLTVVKNIIKCVVTFF